MRHVTAALALLATFGACAGGEKGTAGDWVPHAWLIPSVASGQTGVDVSSLGLWVTVAATDGLAANQAAVEALITLRDAGGAEVPVTFTWEPRRDEFDFFLAIAPGEALAEGWYALEVEAAEGYRFEGIVAANDGVARSRFRVGSWPLLLGLDACPKDGGTALWLRWSEPIVVQPGAVAVSSVVPGGEQPCTLYDVDRQRQGFLCAGGALGYRVSLVPEQVASALASGLAAAAAGVIGSYEVDADDLSSAAATQSACTGAWLTDLDSFYE